MVIGLEAALAAIIFVLLILRDLFMWLGFSMGDTIVIILILSQIIVTLASIEIGCGHSPADLAKVIGHLVTAVVLSFYSGVLILYALMWIEFLFFAIALVMTLYNSRRCSRITH